MSATSGTSSATSGTLGDVPPVSFPGIASGIDYNSIIEKYTADTLQQEKPTQTQINNLTLQNTAILKIQNLIGAVQDSLTNLSNPQTFGAYKATVANTINGSPAASATQITGQSPVAGTYTINGQTVATSTSIVNATSANGSLSLTQPLDNAGTAIAATNGTASNGKITVNGVQLNYDVTTQTIGQIITAINNLLQANDGGSATLNANGTVTLTGVTSIGSGADSGNLEQVLKLDTAQITPLALNELQPLDNESLLTQPTANTVNPNLALSAEGLSTAPVSGQLTVNGQTVNYTTGETLTAIFAAIKTATGGVVTASINSSNEVKFSGLTGAITETGGGNLITALKLGALSGTTQSSTASIIPETGIIVNGVEVDYDPAVDSLNTLISNIESATALTANPVTGTVTGNTVTLTGLTGAVTNVNGGNLVAALKLGPLAAGSQTSTGPITNGALNDITSSSPISGINESSVLNQNNNAGFATAVTSGTFTINGVQFTVDSTKNSLSDLITQINSSAAGVTATYNSQTSALVLTSKTAGPTGILLGASGDTSNFLTAAGLTTASGSTTIAGTQASLTYTDVTGQHTVFSATNDFTSAIPGIDLNITASGGSSAPGAPTFYTVNVASDPSQAETAINAFIKAYNAAISTLNTDTVAPTVTAGSDATTGTATSSSSAGGVLYGNYQISGLKDQLVNLVSGFIPSGSSAYNSLQSVGIELDTNSQSVGTTDADDTTDSTTGASKSDSSFSVNATSGELSALDTTTFEAAYAANTTAVQNLFTLEPKLSGSQAGAQPVVGSNYGFSYLLGSTLANIDGLATFLTGSVVTPDNLSNVLLTSITDTNDQQIDSLQQQITLINNEATAQADQLRAQFTASETQIAELQALQGQIAAIGH
jgi:flagellar hook-associated protein 2